MDIVNLLLEIKQVDETAVNIKAPLAPEIICWICGTWYGENKWELQGLFDCEELAKNACKNIRGSTPFYFIGPVILNRFTVVDPLAWPGIYYPEPKE